MAESAAPGGMAGQQIGQYRIERLLGRGGMGQVFLARHLVTERAVALKLMHGQYAREAAFQARFRREARAAAALTHPNIVSVYDFDEAEGHAYLVMELIAGGTLRRLLRAGAAVDPQWSLARGLELLAQAADALAYAHARGLVHRDVKPANMLLQPAVGGGFALKVGDFGLARLSEAADSIHTQSGVAMGTLAYMAPEQATGQAVDGRADLYALGVMLYELATGALPFEARGVAEAIYKHVYLAPASPRSLRPELPPALELLTLRCMAKVPADRPSSGAELAAALRDLASADRQVSGVALPGVAQRADARRSRASGPAPALGVPSNPPHIQVLDEQGLLRQVVMLRPGGMSLGRTATNDICLDAPSVSRHHLQVLWDGERVLVTDLGSRAGAALDGAALEPQAATPWPFGSLLRVGPYWLRLAAPALTQRAREAGAVGRVALEPTSEPDSSSGQISSGLRLSRSFVGTGRVGVVVEPEALALAPGRPATVVVTLANVSPHEDQIAVSVAGVPESWVALPPAQRLGPWARATVRLTVTAPASPEAQAGDYPVEVRARSRADAEHSGMVLSRWSVQPFSQAEVALAPARAAGRGRVTFRVTVRNQGNREELLALRAQGDGAALRYTFTPPQLRLPPGTEVAAQLAVEGGAPLVGRQESAFEVWAGDRRASHVARGQAVMLPLVPLWVAAAVALLALLTAGGLALAGR